MAHKRSRAITCAKCGGKSYVVANLDDGRIELISLTDACKFPALCKPEFVSGVFDRQFGERIIKPKFGVLPK